MSFSLATHKHVDGRWFTSVVDTELLGRIFEDGELVLDLSSSYYRGEDADEERVERVLAKSYSASFIGERAIALALRKRHIESANIVRISGIPTAQSLG